MCDPTTYLKQSQEVQGADMEGFMILNIINFADMERKKMIDFHGMWGETRYYETHLAQLPSSQSR